MSEFAAVKNAPIDTSKMDLDVNKPAQPHGLSPVSDSGSIPTLDGWIENLMNCKQLAETDVSRLCDRVCALSRGIQETVSWDVTADSVCD